MIRLYHVPQGHTRHGGAGRGSAGTRRKRQQFQPALDGTVWSADQPVDHVDADADAQEFRGRRFAVLLQHGRQTDNGRSLHFRDGAGCHAGRPVRWRRHFGHGVRHPFAVQVYRHVRMITVVDLQLLAVEQFRTFSLVAKLASRSRR